MFCAHGVDIVVAGPPATIDLLRARLGRAVTSEKSDTGNPPEFTITQMPDGAWDVSDSSGHIQGARREHVAVERLAHEMHARIARRAPERLFIHAGVFSIDGRLVVVPAQSRAGKSSLVVEALAQGATYYSDEFAVFDELGQLHPYARPIALRGPGDVPEFVDPVDKGYPIGVEPMRPAAVVHTWFEPAAVWRPVAQSGAASALHLVAHTVLARSRPRRTIETAGNVARHATIVTGPRGDAARTIGALAQWLATLP